MNAIRKAPQPRIPRAVVPGFIRPLIDWYDSEGRALPWRQTRDPYAIWISEIMLQQTQVRTVIPYWRRWMGEFPSLRSLAEAEEPRVLKAWEGLGYYSRARNLRRAAQHVLIHGQGRLPESYEGLLQLPGIGPYTAAAIASIAFGQPEAVLDGNVQRVLARAFTIPAAKRTAAVQRRLKTLARGLLGRATRAGASPQISSGDWNQVLMDLGATVCLARTPRCWACPISAFCQANRQGCVKQYPGRQDARPTQRVRSWVFAVEYQRRWLVRRRQPGAFNEGLWEFPNLEIGPGRVDGDAVVLSALGFTPAWLSPFCTLVHCITHHRFQMTVFRGAVMTQPGPNAANECWVSLPEAARLPFCGAHGKILDRLRKDLAQARESPID